MNSVKLLSGCWEGLSRETLIFCGSSQSQGQHRQTSMWNISTHSLKVSWIDLMVSDWCIYFWSDSHLSQVDPQLSLQFSVYPIKPLAVSYWKSEDIPKIASCWLQCILTSSDSTFLWSLDWGTFLSCQLMWVLKITHIW